MPRFASVGSRSRSAETIHVYLHVWRQKNAQTPGRLVDYETDVSPDMSFLEMLDVVNEDLISKGEEPIAFDYDCREGICGTCCADDQRHGARPGHAARPCCQLHMRSFNDGDDITIEPWRAASFPVVKDLVVDRSAFDRIIQAGGYVSVNTGGAPDGNALPIAQADQEAGDGRGRLHRLRRLRGGVQERLGDAVRLGQGVPPGAAAAGSAGSARPAPGTWSSRTTPKGFGSCTNYFECEAACPKEISVQFIAILNREYGKAMLAGVD